MTKKANKYWTFEDVSTVLTMAQQGKSKRAMSNAIGKTATAIGAFLSVANRYRVDPKYIRQQRGVSQRSLDMVDRYDRQGAERLVNLSQPSNETPINNNAGDITLKLDLAFDQATADLRDVVVEAIELYGTQKSAQRVQELEKRITELERENSELREFKQLAKQNNLSHAFKRRGLFNFGENQNK